MKKIIMVLVCLMTVVLSFTSCSKDNDGVNDSTTKSIVGMWESVYAEGYYSIYMGGTPIDLDKPLTKDDEGLFMRFEFLPNNTVVNYEQNYKGNWVDVNEGKPFYYLVNGNRVRIYESGENKKFYNKYQKVWECNIDNTFTILSLTDNELVIRLDSKDCSNAVINNIIDQWVVIKFKRIN